MILTKAPLPGFSKTRLAAAFGPDMATSLAGAFLDDTILAAGSIGRCVTVAFAPVDAREALAARAPAARLVQQPEGDLGVRIRAALGAAIEDHRAAVLIGSDTPHLPRQALLDAFRALEGADLVVGPASDGGFYLLGSSLRALPEALFEGIAWSSATVLSRLLKNARVLGLRVESLSELTDIDDASSFRDVLDSIRCSSSAPRTRALALRLGLERCDAT